MSSSSAPYFANHDRRTRFPWSLYHRALTRRLGQIVSAHGPAPRVLVVGCGLEPLIEGAPPQTLSFGCDLDERAIAECKIRFPQLSTRLAVCPDPLSLPIGGEFAGNFDVVVAKEVIEHLPDPLPWARALASRVNVGGELVLTTPNYGRFSSLGLLERTVLEWVARRDGYTREHIHPSKFDRTRLAALALDEGMRLTRIHTATTGWTLLGQWRRIATAPPARHSS